MKDDLTSRKGIRAALRRRGFRSVDIGTGPILCRFLDKDEETFLSVSPPDYGGWSSNVVTPGPHDASMLWFNRADLEVRNGDNQHCATPAELIATLDRRWPYQGRKGRAA